MANARDLNQKIGTLNNMQKVMKAMNMIASVKLRKLVPLQLPLFQFEKNLTEIITNLRAATSGKNHPLNTAAPKTLVAHAFVFTADKGLCGSHNRSIQKAVDRLSQELKSSGARLELTCLGNKGLHFARRKNFSVLQNSEISEKTLTLDNLSKFAKKVTERFLLGEIQQIHIVYNSFVSTIRQDTVTQQILPLSLEGFAKKRPKNAIIEGDSDAFLNSIATQYVIYKLSIALVHSQISEQASRMTAMENASNNSQDLINKYVTIQNRLRQTTITNELIEIISGKEALKGR